MTNKDWTAILVGGPRCGEEFELIAPIPELRLRHRDPADEEVDVYRLERASLETHRARYFFAELQDVLG